MESESEKNKIISKCSCYWIRKVLEDHFKEFFGDPSNYKRTLYIRQWDKFFYEEVVTRTNITEDNVRGQLKYISDHIKQGIEDLTGGPREKDKDLLKFLTDLLKECVESEKPVALKRILCWIQDLASHQQIKNIFVDAWKHSEKTKEEGFLWNNQAMIRACEKNDFTMVSHFMGIRFPLVVGEDVEFKINDYTFTDKVKISRNFFFEDNDEVIKYQVEVLKHIRNFQATCSPAFLIAKFRKTFLDKVDPDNFDPIFAAFKCIEICKKQEDRFHEYGDQFRKVEKSLEEFLVVLLDCCDCIDDARLILQYRKKNCDRSYVTKFPRIEEALKTGQEKLIAHDYCQQILREAWHSSSRSRYMVQFQISHTADIILYSISSTLLLPIYVLGFLFLQCSKSLEKNNDDEEKEKNKDCERAEEQCLENNDVDEKEKNVLKEFFEFFSYPVNRAISHSGVYLVYTLILTVVGAIRHHDDMSDLTGFEILIFIMALGFVVPDIQLCLRGSPSRWPLFNSFGLAVVMLSIVLRFIDGMFELRDYEEVFSELQYCLFCFGNMMMVLRIFYYLAMSKDLGIIATCLVSVIGDIFLTTICYFTLLLAFGFGINAMMASIDNRSWVEPEACQHELHYLFKTIIVLFWNLLDPGSIESFGCTLIPQKAPRYLSMILFGIYLVLTYFILINLLVAIISNTMNTIRKERIQKLKFQRTLCWMSYMQYDKTNLPCPLNLLEGLLSTCRRKPFEFKGSETKYYELVNDLTTKYVQRTEDLNCENRDVTQEDLENVRVEITERTRLLRSA